MQRKSELKSLSKKCLFQGKNRNLTAAYQDIREDQISTFNKERDTSFKGPKKIRKAVILVAGFGTRFLPVTKCIPKAMLPIVDKPVIQYLVEEAVASGIQDIIIVTSRGKGAVEDHFDASPELEYFLQEKGKDDLLKEMQQPSKLARFAYVRQSEQLGDGHALLCAKEIIGNEPFAILFGDDIVDAPVPALQQLINIYDQTGNSVIGLQQVVPSETKHYGIIASEQQEGRKHHIKSLIEKPDPKDAPSNLAIIGKYVVTPEILQALENAKASLGGEIRLLDGFNELIKSQPVYGYEMQGKRYDTGNKLGLLMANIDFALKREDLEPALREYLKQLVK